MRSSSRQTEAIPSLLRSTVTETRAAGANRSIAHASTSGPTTAAWGSTRLSASRDRREDDVEERPAAFVRRCHEATQDAARPSRIGLQHDEHARRGHAVGPSKVWHDLALLGSARALVAESPWNDRGSGRRFSTRSRNGSLGQAEQRRSQDLLERLEFGIDPDSRQDFPHLLLAVSPAARWSRRTFWRYRPEQRTAPLACLKPSADETRAPSKGTLDRGSWPK